MKNQAAEFCVCVDIYMHIHLYKLWLHFYKHTHTTNPSRNGMMRLLLSQLHIFIFENLMIFIIFMAVFCNKKSLCKNKTMGPMRDRAISNIYLWEYQKIDQSRQSLIFKEQNDCQNLTHTLRTTIPNPKYSRLNSLIWKKFRLFALFLIPQLNFHLY